MFFLFTHAVSIDITIHIYC